MDLIQQFEESQIHQSFPDIRPGDTVRVHQKIKELVILEAKTKKKEGAKEKERIQIFEGIVLYMRAGKGMSGTFCVRKISDGVGVEKIFPINLPSIVKVEVVKRSKARRAKLFYLRRKEQKETKLKEKKMTEELKKSLMYESGEEKKKTQIKKEAKKPNEPKEEPLKKDVKNPPVNPPIKK
jgi:large subunit ribosomal protein L19